MSSASRLVGHLMLVPLLGATQSLAHATGMALMMLLCWALYGAFSAALPPLKAPALRWSSRIFLAATIVSCLELFLQALSLELHQALGVYPALISLQCLLFDQAGLFERRRLKENLKAAGSLCLLIVAMGLIRETAGSGTLFSLFQGLAPLQEIYLAQNWHGLRLLTLTPGAFILLGLLIAARRAWASRSRTL